jgi:hypothetical protein
MSKQPIISDTGRRVITDQMMTIIRSRAGQLHRSEQGVTKIGEAIIQLVTGTDPQTILNELIGEVSAQDLRDLANDLML